MPDEIGRPRSVARAIPLIGLLCAVAGSVDAVAYLLYGRVFVAGMSGATVMLAISLAQRNMREAALRGALVSAFFAGVLIARFLVRLVGNPLTKKQHIFVLGIQSIVLLMLAWKGAGAHTYLLLVLLASVLGGQNGAFRHIGGLRLNTTFISGDLELLGEAIMSPREPVSKVGAFFSSWIGYAGGAFLGGIGARVLPHHAFLLTLVLSVASIAAVALTDEEVQDTVELHKQAPYS